MIMGSPENIGIEEYGKSQGFDISGQAMRLPIER